MTRTQIGRNPGDSEWTNVSGAELEKFGIDISDAVDVEVVDATTIARAVVKSTDAAEVPS